GPHTGLAEALATTDRRRSASSAKGRPRTSDRSQSPRTAGIQAQRDAQLLPARAPRYHSPLRWFRSVVTPRRTTATRGKALQSATGAPAGRAHGWPNREAR